MNKWNKEDIERAQESVRKRHGLPIHRMDEDPDRFAAARNWAKAYVAMFKEDEERDADDGFYVDWVWVDISRDEFGTIWKFWNFHKEKLDSTELEMYDWLNRRLGF